MPGPSNSTRFSDAPSSVIPGSSMPGEGPRRVRGQLVIADSGQVSRGRLGDHALVNTYFAAFLAGTYQRWRARAARTATLDGGRRRHVSGHRMGTAESSALVAHLGSRGRRLSARHQGASLRLRDLDERPRADGDLRKELVAWVHGGTGVRLAWPRSVAPMLPKTRSGKSCVEFCVSRGERYGSLGDTSTL